MYTQCVSSSPTPPPSVLYINQAPKCDIAVSGVKHTMQCCRQRALTDGEHHKQHSGIARTILFYLTKQLKDHPMYTAVRTTHVLYHNHAYMQTIYRGYVHVLYSMHISPHKDNLVVVGVLESKNVNVHCCNLFYTNKNRL